MRKTALVVCGILAVVWGLSVTVGVAKTKLVAYAPEEGLDVSKPGPEEATIVFLRASKTGGMIAATVYERKDDGSVELITASYPDTYTVHQVKPGKYIFAVVSEAADFIEVTAAGGKIYPIMVTPRMGAWKARFSLRSGCPGSEYWEKMKKWLTESYRVTPNENAAPWFNEHREDVLKKINNYWQKWMENPNRPIVKAEDGVDGF